MHGVMHVMAGALIDGQGRVLLAQRPPGKHLAGLWEFPGGKLEAGESPVDGLVRELREELGVEATMGEPLISVPWRYGERVLRLDAHRVDQWRGEPASLDGQALQWCLPREVDPLMLAPADRHILCALQLPTRCLVTPDEVASEPSVAQWQQRIEAALSAGARLVVLRFPQWPSSRVRELAAALLPAVRTHAADVLLSGDVQGALALGAPIGVQLKAAQLADLTQRPLPWNQRVGASCHDAGELAQAAAIADFATLSPVDVTSTHPDAAPLGWPAFGAMVEATPLPVFALGGMTEMHTQAARDAGAQGIAGIRGFW